MEAQCELRSTEQTPRASSGNIAARTRVASVLRASYPASLSLNTCYTHAYCWGMAERLLLLTSARLWLDIQHTSIANTNSLHDWLCCGRFLANRILLVDKNAVSRTPCLLMVVASNRHPETSRLLQLGLQTPSTPTARSRTPTARTLKPRGRYVRFANRDPNNTIRQSLLCHC